MGRASCTPLARVLAAFARPSGRGLAAEPALAPFRPSAGSGGPGAIRHDWRALGPDGLHWFQVAGERILAGGTDGALHVYDLQGKRLLHRHFKRELRRGKVWKVGSALLVYDGQHLTLVEENGQLRWEQACVVSTLDPDAGVNCAGDFSFSTLPPTLRPLALERFAYLGVDGVRPPFGCDLSVPAAWERRSYGLFRDSLERVQSLVHGRPLPPPAQLNWTDEEAALLDGERVQAVGSLMELARRHPFREFILLQRRGPDLSALSIMELGAYGSCVEGPLPDSRRARWQYLQPGCTPADLQAQLERMPRHCREVVGMRLEQAGGSPETL